MNNAGKLWRHICSYINGLTDHPILHSLFCSSAATSVLMSGEELKKQLAEMERALEGKVSVVLATQHLNHMYSVTADKDPVCALEIGYTVFFQWKQIKELRARLSYSVPSFCHLLNSSIQQGCYSINKCERLESRLKKEYSRILTKYKTLKGQHRASFKTKTTNILIFKEEIAPIVQGTTASPLAGKFSSY